MLEEKGWKGICIEPFHVGYDMRSCKLEAVVVSDHPGQLTKFQVAGPFSGVRSTMNPDQIALYTEEFTKGYVRAKATTTMGAVLQRNHVPDFIEYLSIDVEGHELHALQGIPLWRYTFGAITVDNNRDQALGGCIRGYLEYHGYTFVRMFGDDMGFVRNASQPRPPAPLNC